MHQNSCLYYSFYDLYLSLEVWDQSVREWKNKVQDAVLYSDPEAGLKSILKSVNAFKDTHWYKNCPKRPQTPDFRQIYDR